MKKITDFFKSNKSAVIWAVEFIAGYGLILFILFGFNLFSLSDWAHLAHAELRGFPGFIFGVLILAALPLFIATTTIVLRTKKPLFNLFAAKKKPGEKKPDEKKEAPVPQPVPEKPFPENLPSELKVAFLRAREKISLNQMPAFEIKTDHPVAEQILQTPVPDMPLTGLPLPSDFDVSSDDAENTPVDLSSDAPVFKEIIFDSPSDNTIPDTSTEKSLLIEHLENKKYHTTTDGDVVVANGMAIITHADSDFWIADTDDWFAAGKQKKSPIADVLGIASRQNLQPVIYLAQKNIMDLENRIAEWESLGIRVINSPSDID